MPRYYADKQGEIDFVLQYGTTIIPVEVKGGEAKSAPSFKAYIKNRHPELALRFSKRGYRQDTACIKVCTDCTFLSCVKEGVINNIRTAGISKQVCVPIEDDIQIVGLISDME